MNHFELGVDVFENETALKEEWTPEDLPGRDEELGKLAKPLMGIPREINKGQEPSTPDSILVSGKAGQGKTEAARMALDEVSGTIEDVGGELHAFEVSLKDVNTEYQAVGKILTAIEPETNGIPKGHSLPDLNERMFDRLDEIGGYIILFLDEIDNLGGGNDDLLYQLSRGKSKESQDGLEDACVGIIGVSNDIQFSDTLGTKTDDSFHSKKVHFDPYNANQLRGILNQRAAIAFKDDALEDSVIPKTAALTAQDSGSARQAIRLLYETGQTACHEDSTTVTEDHLETAQEELQEVDIVNKLQDLTVNDQACLLALAVLEDRGDTPARTKEVYSEYKRIAELIEIDKLTKRTIRKKLTNLDTYNLTMVHKQSGNVQGGQYYVAELSPTIESLLNGFEHVDRFEDITQNLTKFSQQSTLSQ
ncbi:cell division control protein 6 [Halorubrum ezzemoulense]|uniref:ORC1-type DNA replication protein n=1 Tax=Halorubrum ezzemoulense TaxID=337243 RepID=A0A238Z3M8_HALEZ|nr:AAA family ATPase [Halorubrum ezzemoulense]SNR77910.1 cell division control protein 6 [Halorubrum ezzemoulense]